jgi:rhamnose utilization protein RhaD (predicted bifunctional aldolase and dehydrogenase)
MRRLRAALARTAQTSDVSERALEVVRAARRLLFKRLMNTDTIDIEQWRREAPKRRAKIEKALAGFKPPRHQKTRL